MVRMSERPTSELILLIFTVLITSTIILGALGIFIVELIYPEQDTDDIIGMLFDLMKVLIGAIIGYLAGLKAPVVGRVAEITKPTAATDTVVVANEETPSAQIPPVPPA